MTPSAKQVSGIIDGIYAAALENNSWDESLARVASATGGEAIPTYIQSYSEPFSLSASDILVSGVHDPDLLRALFEHYLPRASFLYDPIILPVHTVQTPESLRISQEYYSSELVAEFARPLDLMHSMAIYFRLDRDHFVHLAVHRSKSLGPFNSNECQLLELFVPHISRAIKTRSRFRGQEQGKRHLQAALNGIGTPAMEVSGSGFVRWMNSSMRTLVESNAISVHNGTIGSHSSGQSTLLRQRIAQCVRVSKDHTPSAPIAVSIPREGRQPLLVEIMPLTAGERSDTRGALVVATEPDGEQKTCNAWLRQAFDLSSREAQLVTLLAAGKTLKEAAVHLGISIGTTRNYLKNVFRKMKIGSQSQLIWLVRRSSVAE